VPLPLLRLVIDTNTLLRGLLSNTSAAASVVAAAEQRRFVTLLSRDVLAEYRAVLTDSRVIERFPSLSGKRVEVTLARLRFCGDYIRHISTRFDFPRDQRDAKFIELAIQGGATHMVSCDNDLLSLRTGHTDASKRFRQQLSGLSVLRPAEFIARFDFQV
jgi:putative PIN family toxin of toxin-antitoxin system